MASYIDWYLIELDRRLNGRMSAESLYSFASEVEDHLRLKKEDLSAAGMEASQAEKVAVQSFGKLDDVALEALDGAAAPERIVTGYRAGLIAMAVIWIAAVVICFYGGAPQFFLPLSGVILVAAVVLFVGSALSRRLQWKNALILGVIGSVAAAAALPFGFTPFQGALASKVWVRQDDFQERHQRANMQACVVGLQGGLDFYRKFQSVHGDLTKLTLKAPRDTEGALVKLPDYWSYSPEELGLSSTEASFVRPIFNGYQYVYYGVQHPLHAANLQEAQANWLALGPSYLADTKRQENRTAERLEQLDLAAAERTRFTYADLEGGLLLGFLMTLGLIGLNGLAVALARTARRRRIRRALVA